MLFALTGCKNSAGPFSIKNPIYVSDYGSNSLAIVSETSGKSNYCQRLDTPTGIAINPNNGKIYVANHGDSIVSVVSGDSIATSIAVYNHPVDVAVDPETNVIYVSNSSVLNMLTHLIYAGKVSVISETDNHLIKNITVGFSPRGIAVNPRTDKIYVANSGSGDVSVIDGKTDKVISVIALKSGLRGICVNDVINMIYVTNYSKGLMYVINGRDDKLAKTLYVGKNPWDVQCSVYSR